ncbi:MAG: hypothetical protein AB1938_02795 [Myxococcota bacterium]
MRVNQGWAGGAGVMGIISAVMIAGLTGLTIGFNGTDSANYIGGVAILFTGITIPIVAVGAGSSRWDPQITGQFAWRITGWIAFGLAMALSVTALGIAIAGAVFPAYGIAALGGMGVIAAVCHTIDAFSSSAQAAEFAEKGRVTTLRHSPLLVLAPDGHGGMMGLAGWRVTY